MEKKIIYGNDNFGYALIDTSEETPKFSAPVMLPGMISSKIEVEESSTKIAADNTTFAIIAGAKVRSAEAAVTYIPVQYYTECLGYIENASGMITDTGKKKAHCFFFTSTEMDEVTGEETQTLHYIYDVTASEPALETSTVEDEVEAAELTITYESKKSDFVKDDEGKLVGYGRITRTEQNKTWFDTFKTKVLLPTDKVSE